MAKIPDQPQKSTIEYQGARELLRYKRSILYIDYNELFGTKPGNLSPTRRQTTTLKAFVAFVEGSLAAAADGLSRTADGPSLLLMAEEKENGAENYCNSSSNENNLSLNT